ncbi:MAG: hypothetical protein AB1656_16175 [Candidatus Omnitrophota bacterium]
MRNIAPPPAKTAFKITMILCSILSVAIPASAQTDHRIVFIKNLIQDAAEAQWTDGASHPLNFNGLSGPYGTVKRGQKIGGINGSEPPVRGKLIFNDNVLADSIDIEFMPTFGRLNSQVRGKYLVLLPKLTRIQLELSYDLFLGSDSERSTADFYVEVYGRDEKEPNSWVKKEEIHKENIEEVRKLATINTVGEENYCHFVYVAVLSQYAGKEIRLDLVSNVPADALAEYKGRWLTARLVGSTFDYRFVPFESKNDPTVSAKTSNRIPSPANLLQGTGTIYEATDSINLTSVRFYPDESLSTAKIKGGDSTERWFGYLSGTMAIDGADAVAKQYVWGEMAFDLKNYTNYSFYSILADNLNSTLLRVDALANIAPAASGTPYLVAKPSSNPYRWDNSYIGFNSSFTTTSGANKYVHAFAHVEDWYQYPPNYNEVAPTDGNRDWAYIRIGYWRSSANHGYDFHAQKASGDSVWNGSSFVSEASPIIECFMPEWAMTYDNQQVLGTGNPSVVKHPTSGYYYMFYARQLDNNPGNGYGNYPPNVGHNWNVICLARAATNDIDDISGYENRTNPWTNYYNNNGVTWTNGRGGESTPIIDEPSNDYRSQPKVHYNAKFNCFMMICRGPDGFYIYTSNGTDVMDWGTYQLLLYDYSGDIQYYNYPSLISSSGEDNYGNDDFQLYYAYRPSSGGSHSMVRRYIEFSGY